MSEGDIVVGVVYGLIYVVDFWSYFVGDGEVGGVVFGVVDVFVGWKVFYCDIEGVVCLGWSVLGFYGVNVGVDDGYGLFFKVVLKGFVYLVDLCGC